MQPCGDVVYTSVEVRPNPFVVPEGETFTISQVFEENGFAVDRVAGITLSIVPAGESASVVDRVRIEAVWNAMSGIELTPQGAAQAELAEQSVYIDFQFTDPNWGVAIESYGKIYVLGLGPFIFAEGSSEQPIIDLLRA
jgi:hypothetical protein